MEETAGFTHPLPVATPSQVVGVGSMVTAPGVSDWGHPPGAQVGQHLGPDQIVLLHSYFPTHQK